MAVLKELNDRSPILPRSIDSQIPRELETICLKAISKNPLERYLSAKEFADDLERHLEGLPIMAKPTSAFSRSVKWCHRNSLVASLLGLLVATLLIGAITSTLFAVRFYQERNIVINEREEARVQKRKAEITARRLTYSKVRTEMESGLFDLAYQQLSSLSSEAAVRGWETDYLLSRLQPIDPRFAIADGYWGFTAVAIDDSKSRICTCDASGRIILWNLDDISDRSVIQPGCYDARLGRNLHVSEQPIHDRCAIGTAAIWSDESARFLVGMNDGSLLAIDIDANRRGIYLGKNAITAIVPLSPGEFAIGDDSGRVTFARLAGDHLSEFASSDCGSEITCITSIGESAVVAGTRKGRIFAIDREGKNDQQVKMRAPICCLLAAQLAGKAVLAVADGSSNIHFFYPTKQHALGDSEALLYRPARTYLANVHAMSIDERKRELMAIDELGRMSCWGLVSKRHLWSMAAAVLPLNYPDVQRLEKESAEPFCFSRTAVSLFPFRRENTFLTFGCDAAVKLWDTSDRYHAHENGELLRTRVGRAPVVEFDCIDESHLWAGNSSGEIHLVDTVRDIILRTQDVSSAEIIGIRVMDTSRNLLILDGDGRLTKWGCRDDGTLEMQQSCTFEDKPISLALNSANDHLALVTEKSRLIVLNTVGFEPVFDADLGDQRSCPLSGAADFSKRGGDLIASGAGQHVAMFKRQDDGYSSIPRPVSVYGEGVLSVKWNPQISTAMWSHDHPSMYGQFLWTRTSPKMIRMQGKDQRGNVA